jgi:DNA-binding FadR family transcriptional regulator
MAFNLVEPRRLYQAVADQIARSIQAEEYRSGDRLPTERELVRQLGVSRPVIREAMIALEIAGLVEVRSGSGVYVLGRPSPAQLSSAGNVSSEIGPFDIFAARLAVEGEIAAAAAHNATQEDIAEMADATEQMRLAAQTGRSTKPANQRFHMALAIAAKNPMLLKIVRLIWAEVPKRGPIWAKLDEHELILRAIIERNPEHARAATRAHLQAATKDYLEDTAADPAGSEVQVIQETGC